MSLIELENVSKHYTMGQDTVRALDRISLRIERNEYLAFVGASGSGKSTIMNILGALDRPSSGRYVLKGNDVSSLSDDRLAEIRNREIGFIFQSFHLLPRLTALQNVIQPLIYAGLGAEARCRAASSALERVELAERSSHLPSQLSGGQRQRVAIARALVVKPAILLADEPTGNLDSETTRNIMALFDELHAEGHTIIIVTHEAEIAEHCLRVVRLQDGSVAADYQN